MDTAKYILTISGLSHDEAIALMERIDGHLAIDALALTINETDEAKGLWETQAWFADAKQAKSALAALGGIEGAVSPVPERDWVRESLAGLSPVVAGRFFVHGAHDRQKRRAGGVSLEIDAGAAFGTGHHGTTRGCLLALDQLLKSRRLRRILDLGTGTGVLALAAAAVLKRPVLATDIDPEAVRVARFNARLNGQLPFLQGLTAAGLHNRAIYQVGPFDLIFANILARPLANLATGLSNLLAPGGILLLSGLTVDQTQWITATYRARGLVLLHRIALGNWAVLVMTRHP